MSYTHADSPLNKPYNINANTSCNCASLASPPNTLNCSAVASCKGVCGLVSESAVCDTRASSAAGKPVHIPTGVGTANQFAPSILGTNTTCNQRLNQTDQDCCDFGGSGLNAALGGVGEGACLSVKQIIKGAQSLGSAAPGCGVLTPVPLLGQTPCWMIVVGTLGILALVMLKRR